jgi:hypothetical protein
MRPSRWASGLIVILPAAIGCAPRLDASEPAAVARAVPPASAAPSSAATTTPPPAAAAATVKTPSDAPGATIETPPPPFSDGVFPCTDCHEKGAEFDHTRRDVSQHDFPFEHDAEHRWCLDCHDADDRDKLRLASGDKIEFTESYKLCGQCHGDKYRDWRVGVHGRRTGMWNGKKTYLLCVSCHNPHSPRFKPLKPLPPPRRPEQLQ